MNYVNDYKSCLDLIKSNYDINEEKFKFLYNKINYTPLDSIVSFDYEFGYKYLFDLMNQNRNDNNEKKIETWNYVSKKWNLYIEIYNKIKKEKID